MLGERYRVVGLLGRGGMGEVYRADDLTLGQPVALKLLPEGAASDEGKMARFLGEVRIARQVSHPNVCRVYDIGETDGLRFLSMEYVDGEDLATLLRRIGRFSKDKAVQIARQICAGLAAAHAKEVIHRDLKPANVMIDGMGTVRITDFGLAGLSGTFHGAEVRAGTPAYMSPEQLEGKEVTARSDIYALGLVLYELFTGKPAFAPDSQKGLTPTERAAGTLTSPTTHVPDLDPTVERIILQCLEPDSQSRPASALAVAAALPGGDPLAAALAAGETPSPELVAAAGTSEGLRPAVAWALLATVLAGLALSLLMMAPNETMDRVPLPKPPEILVERARGILAGLGEDSPPADTAWGFLEHESYLRHVRESDPSTDRWERLSTSRPAALLFWYRESQVPLTSHGGFSLVTPQEPPLLVSGMRNLLLDPAGNLVRFDAVPPARNEDEGPWPDPDWKVLFEEAGLEIESFEPKNPVWTPPVNSDARAAWLGSYPGQEELEIRVEAASFRGVPVHFRTIGPWTPADAGRPSQQTRGEKIATYMWIGILVVLLLSGILLARRNIRLGRSDLQGSVKLALAAVVIHFIVWIFQAHHVAEPGREFGLFVRSMGNTLWLAALVWVFYTALEPFVRRRWPTALISWTRLLGGGYRDPLVGRDILAGLLLAVTFQTVGATAAIAWSGADLPLPAPDTPNLMFLEGYHKALVQVLDAPLHAVFTSMVILLLVVLLRVILRNQWLAGGVFVLVPAAFTAATEPEIAALLVPLSALFAALWLLVVVRIGFLAGTVGLAVISLLDQAPLTLSLTSWYGSGAIMALLACAALAVYGFTTALAGRPAFSGSLLDD
jgi:serine/threonine-protein kinase